MELLNALRQLKDILDKKTGNISIFKKLIITFVAIIIVPLAISFYIYQSSANNMIVNQISSETMNSMDLVSNSIEDLLQKMVSIALYVNDDQSIKELITEEANTPASGENTGSGYLDKLNRINKFNGIISNIAFNMMGTRCYITIITSSGQKYTNWAYEGRNSDAYLEQYIKGTAAGTGLLWKAMEENYIESDAKSHPYVLTLVKNIFNTAGTRQYGTFVISVPEDEISNLMATENQKQTRVILDENMKVISSTKKEWLDESFGSIFDCAFPSSPRGYFIFSGAKGEKSIISYNAVRNWKIVDIKSYDSITKQLANIQNQLLVVNAVFILCFLGISVLMARNISKPIRRLTKMMLSTDLETSTGDGAGRRNDEIGILEESFNIMRNNIKNLMQDNTDKERKKRDAELKSLQAQISPHFLFNTLNTVRWAAINNNTKKAADMVLALTNLLRMTIVKGDELITVDEEINNLKNYALIFQMRHSIEFRLICSLEEGIGGYRIPKLLLQPLVENAIIHGFEGIEYEGVIEITGGRREGFVVLCVKDNGVGFDVNSMPVETQTEDHKFSGMGVRNVDERIKLYFGDKYGLKMDSVIGRGTSIEAYLPGHDDAEGRAYDKGITG